jgi:hypothetical protein
MLHVAHGTHTSCLELPHALRPTRVQVNIGGYYNSIHKVKHIFWEAFSSEHVRQKEKTDSCIHFLLFSDAVSKIDVM